MNLELRINGTVEELTEILELLKSRKSDSGLQNEPLPIPSPKEAKPIVWTEELKDSFWSDISKSAQDFLMRCVVMSDALRLAPYGQFMCSNGAGLLPSCDPGDFLSRLENAEPGSEPTEELFPCKNTDHMLSTEGVNEDELVYFAGWNSYAIGARIGNIRRTLNRPEYKGLIDPFFIAENNDGYSDEDAEIDWAKYYRVRIYWAEYLFRKWITDLEENNGETFNHLSQEPGDEQPIPKALIKHGVIPMKRLNARNEIARAKARGSYQELFDGTEERRTEENIRNGFPF